jgi:hypothetical protein
MSGESPKKIGRGYSRNLDAGPFQPMIDSWDLHLRAERKSAKTIRTYLEAAQWFAGAYLIPAGFTDWDGVRARQVQEWTITLLGRYSDCQDTSDLHEHLVERLRPRGIPIPGSRQRVLHDRKHAPTLARHGHQITQSRHTE